MGSRLYKQPHKVPCYCWHRTELVCEGESARTSVRKSMACRPWGMRAMHVCMPLSATAPVYLSSFIAKTTVRCQSITGSESLQDLRILRDNLPSCFICLMRKLSEGAGHRRICSRWHSQGGGAVHRGICPQWHSQDRLN